MSKRRRLNEGQPVVVIYRKDIGFVEQEASFVNYSRISVGSAEHEVPVFQTQNETLSGIDCFWLLPEEAKSPENIQYMQYELIKSQLVALEIAYKSGYSIPQKIQDKELEIMAQENVDRMQQLIEKLGFDPRDESWIEKELALTGIEKNWFKFERENALMFEDNWVDIVALFNKQYKQNLIPDQAKALNKKRQRFIMGAFNVRMRGVASVEEWKKAAKKFEETHRLREDRMREWSQAHQDNYPLVRTKKPVKFFPGPYLEKCMERIPHLFSDNSFSHVKEGVALRVLSYDPLLKYIRLDFTEDIKTKIKPVESPEWVKDTADYDMWVLPNQIEAYLDILESLE